MCKFADMEEYILALDQGTGSSKAILFDSDGRLVSSFQRETTLLFPRQGWVEQNAMKIWQSVRSVLAEALGSVPEGSVRAIGVTNQRETTVVWDAISGRPICNAIVWQDRRTSEFCDDLKAKGLEEMIRSKTGLIADAYFSATKIRWILDNVPGAQAKAKAGRLRFGTMDSWLVWNLTGGARHVTDVTNASRTMLFNINTLEWDKELLELFGIPDSMIPEVCDSSGVVGEAVVSGQKIPIAGIVGDQQSALFGQLCVEEGSVKNTYGTGCFLLMNCGHKPVFSENHLLTTVAWKIGDRVDYALEGSIFVGGGVVRWLRDGLGIIKKSSEIEALASSVPDSGGVYFVPALTGMGAPYWDQNARGVIVGLTFGATAAHIARAALEGIAFQTMDVVSAMERDAGILISELKVDGGASENNIIMQFQADILGTEVIRSSLSEVTALGAAYMAGLGVGIWRSVDELKDHWESGRRFSRRASERRMNEARAAWKAAVRKALL